MSELAEKGRIPLRRRARRGSVMLEFALIGVLFFVLLIGIMDFAQFLFVQQAIVDRTRNAARWGAITDPANGSAIRNMLLYSQPTAPSSGTAWFGLTPSMIAVSTPDAGTDDYRLVILVSGYSYQALSPYLARSYKGVPISVSVPLGLYN